MPPAAESPEAEEVAPTPAIKTAPIKIVQHLFLQALLSRKIVPQKAAQQLYIEFCKVCQVVDAPIYATFMNNCNDDIDAAGLKLETVKDELKTDDRSKAAEFSVILINTSEDEVAKMATEYLPQEIAYFRIILHEMMTAPNLAYSLPMVAATRLSSNAEIIPKLTHVSAQILIKSFLAKGWLRLTGGSILSLSARTLTELSPYFMKAYELEEDDDPVDAVYVDCTHCLHIVTNGWKCPSNECPVRLHLDCAATRTSRDCPSKECQQLWELGANKTPEGIPVGVAVHALGDNSDEEEEEETPAKSSNRRASGASSTQNGNRRKSTQMTQDDEDEDLSPDTQSPPPKKKSRAS